MSHTPIRNSPQDEPRRPTPVLRLPQPPVTAPAPTALLRVSELLTTADSTCAKPCMPPPMSSTAVKRMFEPAPSCTRVRCLTSNEETAPATVPAEFVAPVAPADSAQMFTAPEMVTDDWARAT